MPDLLENVKQMQAAGVPDTEIGKYIKQYRGVTRISSPETASKTSKGARELETQIEQDRPSLMGVPTDAAADEAAGSVAATAVRYAPTLIAGAINPSLAIPTLIRQAALAGGSEFAARRIEAAESDPELDTLWNDLKAGGATGVLDLGVNLAFKGMGKAFRKIGEKILMPSEMPLEVRIETAQQILGELPSAPIKKSGKLRRFMGFAKNRPFSLTLGQINAEEQRFIGWLEGIARAGVISRGVMSRFDLRNEKALIAQIEKYVKSRATETTGPGFARFAKRIIGDLKQPRKDVGEMFLPVEAYRKYLYTQFEGALVDSGAVVDGTMLRRFILDNEAAEKGLTTQVYAAMRAEGLVPPLKTPSKVRRSVTTTQTKKVGEESIETMQDITRTDLETGKEARRHFAETGEKASATKGTTQTVRESEVVEGLTETELAQDWANRPVSDVDKIIKIINAHWEDDVTKGKLAKRINRVLSKMKERIEPRFEKAMGKEATELRDTANTFYGKEQDYLHNVAINELRKVIKNNPTRAMSLLGGGTATPNAKITYDKLMSLKEALQFSAGTPRVGEALGKAVSETGFPAGREAMQQMYDETFLKPLRFRMIVDSADGAGRLNPDKFLKMLDKNADVPEYFEEVFGGVTQVNNIKRLMTALSIQTKQIPEKNIFIQLVQAGQIIGLAGGVSGAILSDDVEMKSGSLVAGALVFLGPYSLSKMLTNPTMTRAFTDGISAGARSGRFAMSLRKVAEMRVASEFYREQPTADATKYYTSMEPEPTPQSAEKPQ